MSKRELITQHIIDQLKNVRYINSVTREPKTLEELSRADFPHCLIETANETRTDSSFSDSKRKHATLDVLINIVVHGADRDKQRNTVLEAIEEKLDADTTMNSNAHDAGVTSIEIREIAEAEPYATAAMVYTVEYYYERTKT